MKEPRIEKLVISEFCDINLIILLILNRHESGDSLTRASKVIEKLTGQTPVTSKARYIWYPS
jgi:large subunit ribosomal protein L11e